MYCFLVVMQMDLVKWVKDHRVHHRYTETDADPHDARRGAFFSHIGWLMYRKHPQVERRLAQVDVSDLLADPLVRFQNNLWVHWICAALVSWFVPGIIVWYFWNMTLIQGIATAGIMRYVWLLHSTFFINSAAHLWGEQPYNKRLQPRDNSILSFIFLGKRFLV